MRKSIQKIVSGGQSGVDRAALDTALELGIPCGGWCPKGSRAEDGPIDPRYGLVETPTDVNAQRTEWNARDSHGTLILLHGEAEGGTAFTIECAEKYNRPYRVFQMTGKADPAEFFHWIKDNGISTLNIAGPRESLIPGEIYKNAKRYLGELFA
jgi:hypothetical protein